MNLGVTFFQIKRLDLQPFKLNQKCTGHWN